MGKGRIFLMLLLAMVGVIFLAGIGTLFQQRFAAGDIYPKYSSLRADPIGTKAFHDALDNMEAFYPERNLLPLHLVEGAERASILFLGADANILNLGPRGPIEGIEKLAESGARIVIAATNRGFNTFNSMEGMDLGLEEDLGEDSPYASPPNRWEYKMSRASLEQSERDSGLPFEPAVSESGLDPELVWMGNWRFDKEELGDAWEVVGRVKGEPVIIRRKMGSGELVLVSDSFFVSNEALWKNPSSGMLLWLTGGRPRTVFDESHHGTVASPGTMSMVRSYGLHGFLVGAAIFVGLLIWRSLFPLVASDKASDMGLVGEASVQGEDAAKGLISLMRANVPANELLRMCYLTWAKNPVLRRKFADDQVEAVRDLVAAEEAKSRSNRSSVAAYQKISAMLSRRG